MPGHPLQGGHGGSGQMRTSSMDPAADAMLALAQRTRSAGGRYRQIPDTLFSCVCQDARCHLLVHSRRFSISTHAFEPTPADLLSLCDLIYATVQPLVKDELC